MAFSFHQLHIFYTSANLGSFSAAALALHLTQPAITLQMQALEEHFGTPLFRRSTKKIELTEAGNALMPYAAQILASVRETDVAMSSYAKHLKGLLKLGASLTIGEYILPHWLGPFGTEYPDITIRMKVMNTTQILEEITNRQIDFALIEAPVQQPQMQMEPIMNDELVLVAGKQHPLFGKKHVLWEEALQYPFVLREQGSGTRLVMEEKLQAAGFSPADMRIVMELGSTGAVKSAAADGMGLAFLSVSSVKLEVQLGLLDLLKVEGIRFDRKFYSIYLKTAVLPMSAAIFLTFLRERDLQQWLN